MWKISWHSLVAVSWICIQAAEARRVLPTQQQQQQMMKVGMRGAKPVLGFVGTSAEPHHRRAQEFRKMEDSKDGDCNKMETCAPSVSPTDPPTDVPSATPTKFPTRTPSATPTASPTKSPQPSFGPTDVPSSAPSPAPTRTPSAPPTTSKNPTEVPSVSPSLTPSTNPTSSPTVTPAPSEIIFDISTDAATGSLRSTCVATPPGGTVSAYELSFLYEICFIGSVDEVTAGSEIAALEPKLLKELSWDSMDCSFTNAPHALDLVSISTNGADTIQGPSSADGACYDVDGSITTDVFFPPATRRQRRLTEESVRAHFSQAFNNVFQSLPEAPIKSLTFEGFSEVQLEGTQTVDGSTLVDTSGSVAGAQSGNIPVDGGKDNGALGIIAIAAAGLCLIVMGVLLVRRAKQRQEVYLKHLEEVDALDLDDETKEEMGRRNTIVNYDDDSVDTTFNFEFPEPEHDPQTCKSVTCRICAERSLPIFIAADTESLAQNIKAELGAPKYQPQENRRTVPDTQAL